MAVQTMSQTVASGANPTIQAHLLCFLVVHVVRGSWSLAIGINLPDITASQILIMLDSSGCCCSRHDCGLVVQNEMQSWTSGPKKKKSR